MKENEIIDFSQLAVGPIKIKWDPKFHRYPDELLSHDEEAPIKNTPVNKTKKWNKIFGKPKKNETMEERAQRLCEAYKKIDDKNGRDNDLTYNFILKHIFTSTCNKCGESDWHKLGCDRIDNTKGHLQNNVVCACRKCNVKRGLLKYEDFYDT